MWLLCGSKSSAKANYVNICRKSVLYTRIDLRRKEFENHTYFVQIPPGFSKVNVNFPKNKGLGPFGLYLYSGVRDANYLIVINKWKSVKGLGPSNVPVFEIQE